MARRELPLGQQVHALLKGSGLNAAQQDALELGESEVFDRVQAVASEEPISSFLHSALCPMSLPVRRPADESAPIIRQARVAVDPSGGVTPAADRLMSTFDGLPPRAVLLRHRRSNTGTV